MMKWLSTAYELFVWTVEVKFLSGNSSNNRTIKTEIDLVAGHSLKTQNRKFNTGTIAPIIMVMHFYQRR